MRAGKTKVGKRSIDIVGLGPYWVHGVCLVSVGFDYKELWDFVDGAHTDVGVDRKVWKRRHKEWKDLIHHDIVKDMILKVNDNECSTRGCLVYDQENSEEPCLILLISPEFDVCDTENMITLAHECLHVCQRILPNYLERDVEHEAEAYFHSYLMRECVRIINEG